MSEQPQKWEFRPPPSGVGETDLILCTIPLLCRMGETCPNAHSQRELAEWKRRKSEQVKQQLDNGTYSDKILKAVLSESSSAPPTTQSIPGVKLVVDQTENIKLSKRNSVAVWNIFLSSNLFLKGISLLEVENLQHFNLSDVTRVRNGNITEVPSNLKECTIDDSEEMTEGSANYYYRLKLNFSTKVFGIFKQTVIFDFGTKPLLAKSVNVTVAPESVEDDLNSAKESILTSAPVWDESNSTVVKFSPALVPTQGDEEALLENYPIPQPNKFTLTNACVDKTLTAANYRERFHQLLYMEELDQYKEITGFNAMLNILTTERYLMAGSVSVASTAKYARPGELFGRIELNSELADDSKAGRLILTKCTSVLLKLKMKKKNKKTDAKQKQSQIADNKKVWECLIEDSAKSVIYVRLPTALVTELELKKDVRLKGDVQFKLNRLALAEMHYAVDRLLDTSIVYPCVSPSPVIPWSPSTQWGATLDPKLNVKQKEAVLAITTPLGNRLPPILIIGPYGTGKTFTIGAALQMLLRDTVSKILVCTHSNSAADLYIKDYIDPAIVKGDINKKVLRIYYQNRWVQTVHPTVQKYCLIQTDELMQTRRFCVPGLSDLESADLVVATLSTSRGLAQILKPGHFSHILLDEAAQALETEAIIPLSLANSSTRIVLAGDHMQLEPEIVSSFAMEKRLNLSLLERLYDHYPTNHPCKILLCENYRSHEGIVDFTSLMFYEQKLVSSGKQPPHTKWFPLTFFTARGEDTQDPNSTSYYNNYEVAEIAERLLELKRTWPKVWGKKDEVEVGVVTPYHDQVLRLRSELRKKRIHNISVERVQNVQGKQYRVIFISIVRSRDSCISKKDQGRTDFGFLSSAKLLNTALTRAQSLVCVVGDPVTMCSVGRCSILWQRFLQICSDNNSLFGYTWTELRSNLDAIELKNIYGLNPMAKEFVPKVMAAAAAAAATNTSTPIRPYGMPFFASPPPPPLPLPPPTSVFGRPPSLMPMLPPRLPLLSLAAGGVPLYQNMNPAAALSAAGMMSPPAPASQSPFLPQFNRPMGSPLLPMMGGAPADLPMSLAFPAVRPTATTLPPVAIPHPNHMFGKPMMDKIPFYHQQQQKPNTTLMSEVSTSSAGQTHQHRLENATERILPPGMDLPTMLQTRAAQISWYNFLISVNKIQEAQAFEDLILSEGCSRLSADTEKNGNLECADGAEPQDEYPGNTEAGAATPGHTHNHIDNGIEGQEEQEKHKMRLMFENLMADFERDEVKDEKTPLYLRRATNNHQQQEEQQQLQYQQQQQRQQEQQHQQLQYQQQFHQNHQLQLESNNFHGSLSSQQMTGNTNFSKPGLQTGGTAQDQNSDINKTQDQGENELVGDNAGSYAHLEILERVIRQKMELMHQHQSPSDLLHQHQSPNDLMHQHNNFSNNKDIVEQDDMSNIYQLPTFRPSTDIDWKENNVVKHGVENGGSLGQHSHAGPLLVNGQQQLQQVPTYARVVQTTSHMKDQEEDTLTKIRNLGTFGFQNLG